VADDAATDLPAGHVNEEGTDEASRDVQSGELEAPPDEDRAAELDILRVIFSGVLVGFVGEAAPAVGTVFVEGSAALNDLREAVADFQTGDPTSVLKALPKIAAALQTLKDLMGEVGAAKEHVEIIGKAVTILKDPKYAEYHFCKELHVNGKNIFSRLQNASDHFQKQEWTSFGMNIGVLVAEIITPETEKTLCPASFPVSALGFLKQCCQLGEHVEVAEEHFQP